MRKKILVGVATRTKSSRLPAKNLLYFHNTTVINFLWERLKPLKDFYQISMLTSDDKSDDNLCRYFEQMGITYFRGSENNLIRRYLEACYFYQTDVIIRVTADCPLVSSLLIEKCMSQVTLFREDTLYTTKGNFPVGLDIEVFHKSLLENYCPSELDVSHQEHLTSKLYEDHCVIKRKFTSFQQYQVGRPVTLDTIDDYLYLSDPVNVKDIL